MTSSRLQRIGWFLAFLWMLTLSGAFGGYLLSKETLPEAADFLRVDSVVIADSTYGQDHAMDVNREILESFSGIWEVEIATQEHVHFCSATGRTQYDPEDQLPSPLELFGWWAFDSSCVEYPLPRGCYFAKTKWTILEGTGALDYVRNESNLFCVN